MFFRFRIDAFSCKNLIYLLDSYAVVCLVWENFSIQSQNWKANRNLAPKLKSRGNWTYTIVTFIHLICKLYKSHHRSNLCLHSSHRPRASHIWWFWLDRARGRQKWPLVGLWWLRCSCRWKSWKFPRWWTFWQILQLLQTSLWVGWEYNLRWERQCWRIMIVNVSVNWISW
jgi:hypothetical protein